MQIRLTARHFAAALATAGCLAVSGAMSPAPAALITGTFSLAGTDSYDMTANTISILSNTVLTSTGSFNAAGLTGTSLTIVPVNPIHYDALTGLLFTGISG